MFGYIFNINDLQLNDIMYSHLIILKQIYLIYGAVANTTTLVHNKAGSNSNEKSNLHPPRSSKHELYHRESFIVTYDICLIQYDFPNTIWK